MELISTKASKKFYLNADNTYSGMAANRKLQQQVDSTLKKVDEGIEEFNVMFDRVDPNMNPNQRVCFYNLKLKHL
jgi:hypothetical protein